MAPSCASASFGARRRSIRPVGRCQQSETTLSPASFSISLPKRGPTPGSAVTGANRGNRICGRKAGTAADKRCSAFYILLPAMSQEGRPGMTDPLAVQRRRLHFRSWHRGTREADLILGRFADAHLDGFSAEQLDRYGGLLENSDPDIY